MFSGAASSCCAPVLAGVLTLSAISTSLIQSTAVGLAYVAGMVSPLVVIALLWERFNLSGSLLIRGRPLRLGLGPWRWRVHSTNLLAGLLFLAVGAFVIATAFSGGFEATEGQSRLGEYLRSGADAIIQATKGVPDIWFTLLLLVVLFYLSARAFRLPVRAVVAGLRRRAAGVPAWLRRSMSSHGGGEARQAVESGPRRAGGYDHD